MKPLEAYSIISRVFDDLMAFRQHYYRWTKGYSKDEITAQVMAFEALRRMEEENDDTD